MTGACLRIDVLHAHEAIEKLEVNVSHVIARLQVLVKAKSYDSVKD